MVTKGAPGPSRPRTAVDVTAMLRVEKLVRGVLPQLASHTTRLLLIRFGPGQASIIRYPSGQNYKTL